jgi:hypothetical protein
VVVSAVVGEGGVIPVTIKGTAQFISTNTLAGSER